MRMNSLPIETSNMTLQEFSLLCSEMSPTATTDPAIHINISNLIESIWKQRILLLRWNPDPNRIIIGGHHHE